MSVTFTRMYDFEHDTNFDLEAFSTKAKEEQVYFEYERNTTNKRKFLISEDCFEDFISDWVTIKVVCCPQNLDFITWFEEIVPKPYQVTIDDTDFDETTTISTILVEAN